MNEQKSVSHGHESTQKALQVRILHLSDLHFGDARHEKSKGWDKLPGRRSADPDLATKVAEFIAHLDVDAVVVTGDLTRTGTKSQLYIARNWLKHECGLSARPVIVIPGNHDAFAGNLTQNDLQHFEKEFEDEFREGGVHPLVVDRTLPNGDSVEINVRLHMYDTTLCRAGCFGAGRFKPSEESRRQAWGNEFGCDIALLHHPLFPILPGSESSLDMRLNNEKTAIRFLLGTPFDAVLFGHTHDGFFEILSREELLGQAPSKVRGRRRLALFERVATYCRKHFPRIGGGNFNDVPENIAECFRALGVSRTTDNGQMVKMKSLVDLVIISEMLRLTDQVLVCDPSEFQTPQDFYSHLERIAPQSLMRKGNHFNEDDRSKMAFSMQSNCLDPEAAWRGLHVIILDFENEDGQARLTKVSCEVHSVEKSGAVTKVGQFGAYSCRSKKGLPQI